MSDTVLPRKLGRLREGELLVNELFLSIQGESTHAGKPCFFIRLTGCPIRCVWCDSEYSFFDGEVMTVDTVVDRVLASGARLVEVTGGEPLVQKSCRDLLARLADAGLEVLLETSGAVPIDRVDRRVKRIVDWKCPGSGMETRNEPSVLEDLRPGDELKLVLSSREDYEWARELLRKTRIPAGVPVLFAPVFGVLRPDELAAWILADRIPVRLNLQLHKWIWDPKARGV